MSDTERIWRIVVAWHENWPPTVCVESWWNENGSRVFRFRFRDGGAVQYRFTARDMALMKREFLS